ncbi:MAG: hypothetical protein OEL77_07105 [Nitrosopumilus sp.]|nr:hypothetical protein [Nitrosopumilus sp.]MDH3385764.1 hypothetical protein [Nitrosopumilus sp.]
MTGINYVDTIVVHHNLEKGTLSVDQQIVTAEFMGKETSKINEERLKISGDMWLTSAKGTTKIKLSKMHKEKTINLNGYHITTGRGTSRIQL